MKDRRDRTHTHEYVPHPNVAWDTHYACRICGFAVPRYLIDKIHPELVVRQESEKEVRSCGRPRPLCKRRP